MKNIISGMVAGGVAGLAIDGSMNKKGEHDYLSSLVLGAAVGGIGVGVWGAKAAPGLINTSSHHVAPAPTPHVAPAPAPTPAPTATAATPVQSMPKAPVTSPVQQSTPSAAVSAKPAPAATPQSTEAPKSPILKLNKIKETAGTISSEISNASGKILTSLKAQASSVRTGISRAAYGMANSIATGASKAKGVGYDLLSNLKYSASGIAKSLVATAREAKIPTVNLQLAKLKSPSIDLSLPQTNKRIALLAAAFGIAPQTLHNPQAPMQIVHAQQTMSTSSFGASAHDMVSQALDDVIHAIPRMMEHPRQTIQKAYNASAAKQAVDASAISSSRMVHTPMEVLDDIRKESTLNFGINKNIGYGNKLVKSNKINDLNPDMQEKANAFIGKAKEDGLDVYLSETFRNFNMQDSYFKQGRSTPGGIITNAMGGEGLHSYGLAFDAYPVVNGRVLTRITKDNKKYWDRMGEIGESVGLKWGGRWKEFPDNPHFELNTDISVQDMRKARLSMLSSEQKDRWVATKITDLERRLRMSKDRDKKNEIESNISDVKQLRSFKF